MRSRQNRRNARVPVEVVVARGEHLPLSRDSLDTVVLGYVLCTVADPSACLSPTADRLVDQPITIERARPEEAPALRALHELSLVTLSGDVYTPEQLHGLLATRDTAPADLLGAGRMLVARRHGFIVGSAGWEARTVQGRPSAHLRSVFVHPLQTRRGVASSFLRAVEAEAARQGARHFTLAATLNAVPFYQRLGYSVARQGGLDLGGGIAFPVTHMAKRHPPQE